MKEELDLRDFDVLGIIELDDIQGIEKYVTPIMKKGQKVLFYLDQRSIIMSKVCQS